MWEDRDVLVTDLACVRVLSGTQCCCSLNYANISQARNYLNYAYATLPQLHLIAISRLLPSRLSLVTITPSGWSDSGYVSWSPLTPHPPHPPPVTRTQSSRSRSSWLFPHLCIMLTKLRKCLRWSLSSHWSRGSQKHLNQAQCSHVIVWLKENVLGKHNVEVCPKYSNIRIILMVLIAIIKTV